MPNPYANFNPEGHAKLWQACHEDMLERWDPERAGGMTREEFDEQSKEMSISAYLHYESRQAPIFSDREDQTIARAFGEEFARELRDIHEGKYDTPPTKKKRNRIGKFITKLLPN